MNQIEQLNLYANGPQLRSELMKPNTELDLAARGTGKTMGIISSRIIHNAYMMPRSTGAIITKTFRQALTNTLPPAIAGFKRRGLVQGLDFVIGKKPPEWFAEPIVPPLSWQYTIAFSNGTVVHLVSQDREGSANGLSIDWKIVDECKYIDKEQYDAEVVPASRGNIPEFGHLSCHQSTLFCTDRWYGPEGKWIDELIEKQDHKVNALIKLLSYEQQKLEYKIATKQYSESYQTKLQTQINSFESELNELRMDAIWVNYASAIENYYILGKNFFLQQRQALTSTMFDVTVLNKKKKKADSPFYPHLDRSYHCYNSFNYDAFSFDNPISFDCTGDKDLIEGKKLYVTVDPGAVINTVVVGQLDDDGNIRIINALHVESPALISHAIEKFCNYYAAHNCHDVVYYYNPTHTARHGATEHTYYSLAMREFKKHNWNVAPYYYTKVPEYKERYNLSSSLLSNREGDKRISFNEINCDDLLIAMEDAETMEADGKLKKNKKSEKAQSKVDPKHATHYTDAFDDLIWGMHNNPHPLFNRRHADIISV